MRTYYIYKCILYRVLIKHTMCTYSVPEQTCKELLQALKALPGFMVTHCYDLLAVLCCPCVLSVWLGKRGIAKM